MVEWVISQYIFEDTLILNSGERMHLEELFVGTLLPMDVEETLKKAVKKLYIPLMLSMMIISLYNSIDSF